MIAFLGLSSFISIALTKFTSSNSAANINDVYPVAFYTPLDLVLRFWSRRQIKLKILPLAKFENNKKPAPAIFSAEC
jgi:hypothetical protein